MEDHYSPDATNTRVLKEQREDFDDLQNERAGRDNGKAARFTSEEERIDRKGGETKSTRRSNTDITLHVLLQNDTYRMAHEETMRALQEAERWAQYHVDATQGQLSQNDAVLQDIQNRASTLPNGTRVYRNADGHVFGEDGALIASTEAEAIVWREDNPSYEDYRANREHDAVLQNRITRLYDYQVNTLGYIRGRMTDPDNSVQSADEFADFCEQINNRPVEAGETENTPVRETGVQFSASIQPATF